MGCRVRCVEYCSGVGGELAGIEAPVDDFGVGVPDRTGQSHGGGCVEGADAEDGNRIELCVQ